MVMADIIREFSKAYGPNLELVSLRGFFARKVLARASGSYGR